MKGVTIWTIYNKPKDYPKNIVARKFEITLGNINPTNDIHICNTLDEARSKLPWDLTCLPRDPTDEPHIIESWI